MNNSADPPAWQARPEGGQRWIMRLYVWFALTAGRTAARWVLPLVAGWFFLFRGPERSASREFLSKATGKASLGQIYRHFLTFAQVVLDRVFLMASNTPPVDLACEGLTALDDALALGQGCLLVGSHLGSFEACRLVKEQRPEVPLRILMDRQLNANATAFLELLNPELASQVIALGEHPAENVLKIRDALDSGGLVALLADRAVGQEDTTEVNFLGCPALLPTAPYLLASLTQAPVVLFFGLYQGRDRYRVVFETFTKTPLKLARRRQREPDSAANPLQNWAQRFADRLAHHTRANPYNWFNFYPFWSRKS